MNHTVTIDASEYVALGCIALGNFRHEQDDSTQQLERNLRELETRKWIRTTEGKSRTESTRVILIWVLPSDSGRAKIDRGSSRLRQAMAEVIRSVDTSSAAWKGTIGASFTQTFDPWASLHAESLFYIFNNLPSPAPDKANFNGVSDKYVREAMEDLLESQWFTGLKTTLYPYQRRSAALMLQREERGQLLLDPRLEQRTGPDGKHYYYNPRDGTIFKTPQYYESCRGGILAETMGLGKTLICLALISSTKHHLPKMPHDRDPTPMRDQTPSLAKMAIDKIRDSALPWQIEFARMEHYGHGDMARIQRKLDEDPPDYLKSYLPPRWNRATILPPPKRLVLAPTTIIVVPRNLCKQWHSEISKHVADGALNVLLMEEMKKPLPRPDELRKYDLILFARSRFELELRDGADENGRRLPPAHIPLVCRCPYIGDTRQRLCNCLKADDLYDSPLKHLHFKRLIVDEGLSFSAKVTKAVLVANNLVVADHRWVISGTPAKDLLGVELDSSALENWSEDSSEQLRSTILEQRRQFTSHGNEAAAVRSIGALASVFLQVRPWYSSNPLDPPANWDDHVYRHEAFNKRTHTCYSSSLPRMLEALVVKTRPQDVERDIELPPLHHEVVYLEPSFFDKLTANLFTLVLTANAITSERTDQDYLFHKNSAKPRQQLITNLRQSAFFWTGFSEQDVLAVLKNGRGYLEKDTAKCSPEDRKLLTETLKTADAILSSVAWNTLSLTHEMGLYVTDWPEETAEFWAFDEHTQPLLTGISQASEAQLHVNLRAEEADPGEGLSGLGISSIASSKRSDQEKGAPKTMTMSGMPTSSLSGEPKLLGKNASIRSNRSSPKKSPTKIPSPTSHDPEQADDAQETSTGQKSTSPRAKRRLSIELSDLPEESSYRRARVIGTTSAKLSYLTSQVLMHYQDEKILIFYDGDNVAYYIAQMLELLHIKHEIYAKSLNAALKSEYVVRFDKEEQDRVLLMDVKQAAFGLNITSASRIYFVNPVCRPNIEAQAIKRAHRIGQTRKVHVETLILRGTIEEKIHARSKRMTNAEHLDAKVLEDDGDIREIIQSAKTIPLTENETTALGQMAPLETPQQIWARQGWQAAFHAMPGNSKKRQVASIVSTPSKKISKTGREIASDSPVAHPGSRSRIRLDVMDVIH